MKANRAQAEKALRNPAGTRLFLLHGPDEAGSRALAALVGQAMGSAAERIDLAPATLKADPARLTDEAASVSLFGDPRWIRVDGAGDESLPAIAALLEAASVANPVVVIAGTLRATSKLLKLALADRATIAFASYAPSAQDMARLAADLGRAAGLRIDMALAQRLAAATGGDRAVLAAEIEKYALYCDADAQAPVELTDAAVDALSADVGDADLNRLVAAALSGRPGEMESELARLAAVNIAGVPLVRAVQRRLLQLVDLRGQVEEGNSIASVLARPQNGVWESAREGTTRELRAWTAEGAATALARIAEAGRVAMSARGPGELSIEHELGIIARRAARAR